MPVRKRSSASFAVGWTSSAVGPIDDAPGAGGSDADGRAGAAVPDGLMTSGSLARVPVSLGRAGDPYGV